MAPRGAHQGGVGITEIIGFGAADPEDFCHGAWGRPSGGVARSLGWPSWLSLVVLYCFRLSAPN